jgi:biopolymer transport protein ExbD
MSNKKQDGGSQGVQLGLIITPMLDMSFQIMAFFIMTYNPSALEGHIPGSLVPPENFAKKSKDSNPVPMENPLSVPEEDLLPELQEAITIRAKAVVKGSEVGSRTEGMLSQVSIKTTLDTEATLIADESKDIPTAMKMLEKKLKAMAPPVEKGKQNKSNLKIAADGELKQQYIMMIYDTAKKSGFANIHFVPPPVLNAKLGKG